MTQATDGLRVAVIGAGTMGCGIAQVCASRGLDVIVLDANHVALESGRARVTKALQRVADRASGSDDAPAMARLSWSTELESLADRDLIVEAIVEDFDTKAGLIRGLESVVSSVAVLASNTSSIPIGQLAACATHPERVVGLHFFNPVPRMPLVEFIPSLLTSEAARETSRLFVTDGLGKTVVDAPDRAGFLVNALLVPYLLSAIRSVEQGVASIEDVDAAMVAGCGMPMGPLSLADLVGLDVLCSVADSLHREYRSSEFVAPSLLRRHVDAGLLGRKSGRGFFDYSGHLTEGSSPS